MNRHRDASRARVTDQGAAPGQNRPQRTGPQGRRFQTVTAMLLTDDEFPGELGESFAAACAAVGVKPVPHGYGLVLAQDEDGGRWTQVTSDARSVHLEHGS